MQNRFYSASDLRARARAAIRTNPPTLLMLVFLASLPSLISSTVSTLTQGGSLSAQLYTLMMNAADSSSASYDQLLSQLEASLRSWVGSTEGITAIVTEVIVWLITPVLSLGLIASLLKLLRNEPVDYADVFCRMGCFFKAIGLKLLTGLKILLWMLPGMALSMASVLVLVWTRSSALYLLVFMAGMVLMLVLGFRAALHYILAETLLADSPAMGVRAALKESVGCMRTRKLSYVSLYVSFIGWLLLANVAELMLDSVSPVIGMVAGMVCSLLLSLYMNTAFTAFYMQEYLGNLPDGGIVQKRM